MGPIYYCTKFKKESKAYILSYISSVSRAVHLELAENLTSKEFIKYFKRMIAQMVRPKFIYSDNAETLQAAAGWGGQFERLIGFTKQALYKLLGKTNLNYNNLKEVLLHIQYEQLPINIH